MEKITPIHSLALFFLLFTFMSCKKDKDTTRDDQLIDARDQQSYQTMEINGLNWMAENLRYSTADIGWTYNNDPSLEAKYGRMYNWEMAQQVCPVGWRLPSKAELEDLSTALNTDPSLSDFLVAGGLRQNEEDPNQYVGLTEYQMIDTEGFYWSNTESPQTNVNGEVHSSFFLYFDPMGDESSVAAINKEYGISIRCVEN
ncbi:MAG: hypothetical protein KTR30_16730 [Saprospiraceae bacterium]|nr:hypothetical protein [Saprospiraceae bacterium]